jgi:uncharacterized membrane protein
VKLFARAARRFHDMKSLILTFLPLIVFSLLSRFLPHVYIGIAGSPPQ